ncbi:MAG: hypothetical protein GX230_03055 [Lentisphaerae bacterium]|nr:hypothetical protein [Lentisphaerota bacterium]
MERVNFNGWESLRLANSEIELIVTRDVGPRVIRFGYVGAVNLFRELPGDQGGRNESEWKNRGGHRFWVAPEAKPWSYELDNVPYESAEAVANGMRLQQAAGPLTGLAKEMEIVLDPDKNVVRLVHTLSNDGQDAVQCAPWAPTVMNRNGQAVIPMPAKISHTERVTHNQEWSLWTYTDMSDPRWTFGKHYLLFRQDPNRGPNKIGLAHREKWAAYQLDGFLFVKYFDYFEGQAYPDGGVNFETFSNEEMLEIESLGPLVSLRPGDKVSHVETWRLFKDVPLCKTDAEVDKFILPLVNS